MSLSGAYQFVTWEGITQVLGILASFEAADQNHTLHSVVMKPPGDS